MSDKKTIVAIQQRCPYCWGEQLIYGNHKVVALHLECPVECKKCGGRFDELYSLPFIGQRLDDGTEIEAEPESGEKEKHDEKK